MIAATAMIVAALAVPASTSPGRQAQREPRSPQTDQTVSVSRGARLVVNNFAGEVVVRTWDRDQLRVQARHTLRTKINVRTSPTAVSIGADTHGPTASVDYEITAPSWMPMKIEGTYNFVTIEGAQSEVSAESVRGDVVIKGGTGTIVARSIQGGVSVEGARGRINVSSVNEDIRISGASGDITAETTNGHITLSKIMAANVELATINGNVLFEGTVNDKGRYRFTTHNGNILVGVPDESNVSFIVRTYNGSFASSLNVSGPPKSEARRGRRVTYTLGSGSAEMEMETFGGSIRLMRPGAMASAKDKEKDY